MIDVSKNIEAIRLQKGVKQSELGKKLGVKQSAYSHWINRCPDMPLGRLFNIAEALDVSVLDIITYPEHYVPESTLAPECEECKQKQKTIDNLNLLIDVLNNKLNRKV